MAYDKNTDYQAIINQARDKGDYVTAQAAEAARNEKINAMNSAGTNAGGYSATYNYNALPSFSGSTSSVGNVSSAAQSIIDQMNNNSKLWYTDPANRVKYANENQNLSQQLAALYEKDGYTATTYTPTYDSATGTWTVTPNYSREEIATATSQNNYLDELFKAREDQALADLKAAYDENLIGINEAASKIPAIYQTARNQTAASSEQNRAAFNEQALAHGINSGTGSQASLAMSNQLLGDMSAINAKESDALENIETERLKLWTNYNNAITQAKADGNLAKAQALYNEAVRVDESLVSSSQVKANLDYNYWSAKNSLDQMNYEKQMMKAQQMAAFGNFSGYLALGYTQDEVNQMRKAWIAQNPLLAKALGIS